MEHLRDLQSAALKFVTQVQRELLSTDENLRRFDLDTLGALLVMLDPNWPPQAAPTPHPFD